MIEELEKELLKIGIQIKVYGYYKTIGEVYDEISKKWNTIPLEKQNDFIEAVSRLLKSNGGNNE